RCTTAHPIGAASVAAEREWLPADAGWWRADQPARCAVASGRCAGAIRAGEPRAVRLAGGRAGRRKLVPDWRRLAGGPPDAGNATLPGTAGVELCRVGNDAGQPG